MVVEETKMETKDSLLLLLLLILLPLRILSFALRLRRRHRISGNGCGGGSAAAATVWSLVVVLALMSTVFGSIPDVPRTNSKLGEEELQELKLQIDQLESLVRDNAEILEAKSLHLEKSSKIVEEMEQKIEFLRDALHEMKSSHCLPCSTNMVKSMEEEVQKLWEESRKNNFEIHKLDSKGYDATENLESVASLVQKMESIVTEQWIQIRQLEQSLYMTKDMTSKVHKRSASKTHRESKEIKRKMLKVVKILSRFSLPDVAAVPNSFLLGKPASGASISRLLDWFKGMLLAIRKWHHELQYKVQEVMEMNEYTAPFANREVVFFLASAMITFPIMSVWVLCSFCFDEPVE